MRRLTITTVYFHRSLGIRTLTAVAGSKDLTLLVPMTPWITNLSKAQRCSIIRDGQSLDFGSLARLLRVNGVLTCLKMDPQLYLLTIAVSRHAGLNH